MYDLFEGAAPFGSPPPPPPPVRPDYESQGYIWVDGLLYMEPHTLQSEGSCGPDGQGRYTYLTGEEGSKKIQEVLNLIAQKQMLFAIDFETSCRKTAPVDPETGAFDLSQLSWSTRDGENGSEPYTSVVFLMAISTVRNHAYVVDVREVLSSPGFRESLAQACTKGRPIAHNFSFEWQFIKALTGAESRVYFDPMIGTQLLYAGLPDPDIEWTDPDKGRPKVKASLDAVLWREMRLVLSKTIRQDFLRLHPDSGMTDAHIAYVAGDTALLLELTSLLRGKLEARGLWSVWTRFEAPFLPILTRTKYEGVRLDIEKTIEYWKEAKEEKSLIEGEWRSRFPGVPIQSQPSVLAWLQGKYPTLAIKSVSKEILQELEENYPDDRDLDILLRFRKVSIVESTFLRAWVMTMRNPVTGRLHPDFQQAETDTGRMSCKNPRHNWGLVERSTLNNSVNSWEVSLR